MLPRTLSAVNYPKQTALRAEIRRATYGAQCRETPANEVTSLPDKTGIWNLIATPRQRQIKI